MDSTAQLASIPVPVRLPEQHSRAPAEPAKDRSGGGGSSLCPLRAVASNPARPGLCSRPPSDASCCISSARALQARELRDRHAQRVQKNTKEEYVSELALESDPPEAETPPGPVVTLVARMWAQNCLHVAPLLGKMILGK